MPLSMAMARIGTESAFDVMARAAVLKREGRDIIDLSIGQSDFRTPENVVEAGVKALRDGKHYYTPTVGIPELREAVAHDIFARKNVEVSPDNVVIVPGGKVTMFFAIQMFSEPGAEILYPNPGFPIYESLINFTGGKAVPIPILEENGFAFSADTILERLTPQSRLLILNSPANPTGGVSSKEELDKLVAGLEKFPNLYILSDEIYSRMLYDGYEHISPLQYASLRERTIVLDGWSKTYSMGGWRLGYGLWPKHLVEHAARLAINTHSCVSSVAQYAGIEALLGPQDEVERAMRAFAERREVVVSGLNEIDGIYCHHPLGAFYAFANVKNLGQECRVIQKRILEEGGVATVPGTSFGSFGEGYIRLSYANSVENIREAVKRIATVVA